MKTKQLNEREIEKAAALIKKGEIVAFPTDTVYGLGADARNETAVQKIFTAKKRPANRALSILLAEPSDIYHYAKDVPKEAERLVETFWPGALTIVLKANELLAKSVHPDLDTVGMRMPNHPLTLKLINECGFPLATPSANLSGRPSPTSAKHVLSDLEGRIAAVIDGGESEIGMESTVLDLSNPEKPVILRPGGIKQSQIEKIIGKKIKKMEQKHSKEENTKHYEPETPLYMVESNWTELLAKMTGEKIAILASEEIIEKYGDQAVASYSLGKKENVEQANKVFFKAIRALEKSEASRILVETYPMNEANELYMNRLRKAANQKKL